MSIAAVLLLDGLGARRPADVGTIAAPFALIAGQPLVTRQILTLVKECAESIVIVAGSHDAALTRLIAADKRLSAATVEIITGPRDRALPRALAAAAQHGGRVLVAAGDVLFGAGVVRHAGELSGLSGPVRWRDGVDLFIAPAAALEGTSAVSSLANSPTLPAEHGATANDAFVLPVTRRADLHQGKRAIFANVTKTTSGWISKNINSKLSKPISWVLSELPITPNMITVFGAIFGSSSGLFIARGDTFGVFVGGLIFQIAAALDRCDGEIARAKFQASRYGAWIDTVGDNVTYLSFVVGLTIGAYQRSGERLTLYAGLGLLVVTSVVLAGMFTYLAKNTDSGSLTDVQRDVATKLDGKKKPMAYRVLNHFYFVGKRDFFSMAVFWMCAFDLLLPLFWATIGLIALVMIYYGSTMVRLRTAGVRIAV